MSSEKISSREQYMNELKHAPVSYTHLDVYKRQVCALWVLI